MKIRKKGGPSRKRGLLIGLSLGAMLLISLFLFLSHYLDSSSFFDFVETTLERRLEKDIEIGSISRTGKSTIIIKDLIFRNKGENVPMAVVPYMEIGFTLSGFLKRSLERIAIVEPKIFLRTGRATTTSTKRRRASLPFTLKSGSVEGGELTLLLAQERSIPLNGIDLSLKEVEPTTKARVAGKINFPDLESTVSINAIINMGDLTIDGGHIETGLIRLERVVSKYFPLLKRDRIEGSLRLKADVSTEREDLIVEIMGSLKNFNAGKESMLALLKDTTGDIHSRLTLGRDYQSAKMKANLSFNTPRFARKGLHQVVINAQYDGRAKELRIMDGSLSSYLFGTLDMGGTLKNFPSRDTVYDIDLRSHNLSVSGLTGHLLKLSGKDFKEFEVSGLMSGSARITGSPKMGFTLQTELSTRDLFAASKSLKMDLREKPVKFALSGAYYPEEKKLDLRSFTWGSAPIGAWKLRGSLQKVSSGETGLDFKATGKKIPLGGLKDILSGPALTWLSDTDMGGFGNADFRITGRGTTPLVEGFISVKGNKFKRKDITLGPFEGKIPLVLKKDRLAIGDALVKGDRVRIDISRKRDLFLHLNEVELSIPTLTRTGPSVLSGGLLFKAEKADIFKRGRNVFTEEGISLTGKVESNNESGLVALKDFSLNVGSIEEIAGDISIIFGEPTTLEAALLQHGFDIEKTRARFPHLFPVTRDFSLKGTGTIRTILKGTFPVSEPIHLSGKADLHVTGGGFSSPEATVIGEGITMKVASSFDLSFPLKKASFTLDAEAADFELLSGRFYGDFKDKKMALSLEGEYLRESDTLIVSRGNADLTDMGNILFSGRVSNLKGAPVFDTEIHLTGLSNREIYDFFIRETFQESYRFLSRMEVGGMTGADLSVKGRLDRFHVQGKMQIRDMDVLGNRPDIVMTGVDLTLPVNISYPEVTVQDELDKFGSLTVQRISWASQEILNLELFPALWKNSLIFREDIPFPVFGGDIILENISYNDLFSPGRTLLLSIDIKDVNLEPLSVDLGMPRFGGSLAGTIPEVRLTGKSFLTDGEIVLELFGGEMRMKEISVDNVFTPIASFKSSIEMKDIDLGLLTGTFEFGHISGIIQGYVRDLVISNRQPESFSASFETVKQRGVSQKISVEALEKISILGTGTSATVFGRGIYRLFKKYRYKKIGFSARLKNDKFVLRGIEREGNRGYLVKGGFFPPKVNVINYTQSISFKELVKRLKRIRLGEEDEGVRVE